MRKLEKNSPARQNAKALFENSLLSNREIAKEVGVSEKTIRNWADAGLWERKSALASADVRDRGPPAASSSRSTAEISDDFCGTLDVLWAELDTAVRNLRLLQEIAAANIDDASDEAVEARRRLVDKVLRLPGLMKMANDLAAALSRVKGVEPGKKERAKDAAAAIAAGAADTGDWGDDLAVPASGKFN